MNFLLRSILSWAPSAALVSLLALGSATAQKAEKGKLTEKQKIDSFTKGDPEKMAKLGVVSYGPFVMGSTFGSQAVDKVVGEDRIRWMETEHFFIGSTLGSQRIPTEPRQKKAMRKELALMKAKSSALKPKGSNLSPWFRMHLYAHRLESLYTDFSKRLGVSDEDFAEGTPCLGMKRKIYVMLFEKEADLGRFARRFGEHTTSNPSYYFDPDFSSFGVGTGEECFEKHLQKDHALHGSVAYNVAVTMLLGYQGYSYPIPHWIESGIGNYYARNIDPESVNAGIKEGDNVSGSDFAWQAKVKKRLGFDVFEPGEKLFAIVDYASMSYMNHVMSWSRIDYLMNNKVEGFGAFIKRIKGLTQGADDPEVLAAQTAGLVDDLEFESPADFDKAWKKWVMKNYDEKERVN